MQIVPRVVSLDDRANKNASGSDDFVRHFPDESSVVRSAFRALGFSARTHARKRGRRGRADARDYAIGGRLCG